MSRSRAYRAAEAAVLAGVNYNTLLFWLRSGWIAAAHHPGRGWAPVLFSARDLERVRRLARLRRRHEREWARATGRKVRKQAWAV